MEVMFETIRAFLLKPWCAQSVLKIGSRFARLTLPDYGRSVVGERRTLEQKGASSSNLVQVQLVRLKFNMVLSEQNFHFDLLSGFIKRQGRAFSKQSTHHGALIRH